MGELEAKKKAIEDQKKAAVEALRKKKEEEEARKKEMQAALAIRRVIQKLRLATPDNFDSLKQEYEELQASEGPSIIPEKTQQALQEEAAKALELSTKRIESQLE